MFYKVPFTHFYIKMKICVYNISKRIISFTSNHMLTKDIIFLFLIIKFFPFK